MLLERLSRRCGQLVVYPESGAPAVIVEYGMDIETVYNLWSASLKHDDAGRFFFDNEGY
jgi:hypothetical protein